MSIPISLNGHNLKEVVTTWARGYAGEERYIVSPVRSALYCMIKIERSHWLCSVPRGYSVTVTARNARTGALLFTRNVQTLRRLAVVAEGLDEVEFTVSYPPSELKRVGFSARVWNPRVTLYVASGTSGRVVDEPAIVL